MSNRMLRNLWLMLRVIATPGCWFQNDDFSRWWDDKLKALLASSEFCDIGPHSARLGKFRVWTSNHPYASFTTEVNGEGKVRPSRRTILAAHDKLMNQVDLERDRSEEQEYEELFSRLEKDLIEIRRKS